MVRIFYRSTIAFIIHVDDNNICSCYMGINVDHEFHGRRFVSISNTKLYKTYLPFANETLGERWWMRFESESPYSVETTIKHAQRVADALTYKLKKQESTSGGFKYL